MKQICQTDFKSSFSKIIKEIQHTGDTVVIIKHGVPVAKVTAMDSNPANLFGFMIGEFRIIGDIESPIRPQKHRADLK
ncbi:MAG TPA: type II toxin-antitoxin system Phd/YefM family antitoxin [Candidatus Acidoferrum sp.]|nr:type II toxin-antitoxin system Phd/YefM family antitoxin [Candidatus Acidoferrum sp.]